MSSPTLLADEELESPSPSKGEGEGGGEGEGKGSKAQGGEGKSENCMALPDKSQGSTVTATWALPHARTAP